MKISSKQYNVILDYIKTNPGATPENIKENNPRLTETLVWEVLMEFYKGNILIPDGDDGGYMFVPSVGRKNIGLNYRY